MPTVHTLLVRATVITLFLPFIASNPAPISRAPYPQSLVIRQLEWAPQSTMRRAAKGRDNFPIRPDYYP